MRSGGLIDSWLEGLSQLDVTWIELRKGAKAPARAWTHYQSIHASKGSDLELANRWLHRGGLAFLPANGLWAFDADTRAAEDLAVDVLSSKRIACPTMRTPGGGRHFYGSLPPDLRDRPLKAHVHWEDSTLGIKADFKLTGRTSLVAPGTERKGRHYQPETYWFHPPIIDPRAFWSEIELMKPSIGHGVDEREDHQKRVASATARIKHTAPAIEHRRGHQTLSRLVKNVVAYHRIDPGLAFYLLTHPKGTSWNDRCSPPWSAQELWSACEGAVDAISPAGRSAFLRRARRADREESISKFIRLMQASQREGTWAFAMDLFLLFCEWSGCDDCTQTAFGKAIGLAGFERKKRSKGKLIAVEGVDLDVLRSGIRAAA